MSSSTRSALIFGCGYLGRRVADGWVAEGRPVAALTRSRADALAKAGITPVVGDVLDPAALRALPAADTVVYAVGYDRRAGKSMRDVYVQGLANVLDALARTGPGPTRFVYVSSTSVYGQSDGEEVDELSLTAPTQSSAAVVLDAEALLRDRRPDAIALRFAGIYGPGRLLRKQPLLNGDPFVGDADKWLNLIHVADGVRAVRAAEAHGKRGETYNIADGTPVRRRDFYTRLAELLGAPPAQFEPFPEEATIPHEANRKIDARKARVELGFRPEFPDYKAGLAAAVAGG